MKDVQKVELQVSPFVFIKKQKSTLKGQAKDIVKGGSFVMRSFVGNFALTLGFVALASAFHTPYRPEQSRHYDVTRTTTFKPITEKVKPNDALVRERTSR